MEEWLGIHWDRVTGAGDSLACQMMEPLGVNIHGLKHLIMISNMLIQESLIKESLGFNLQLLPRKVDIVSGLSLSLIFLKHQSQGEDLTKRFQIMCRLNHLKKVQREGLISIRGDNQLGEAKPLHSTVGGLELPTSKS